MLQTLCANFQRHFTSSTPPATDTFKPMIWQSYSAKQSMNPGRPPISTQHKELEFLWKPFPSTFLLKLVFNETSCSLNSVSYSVWVLANPVYVLGHSRVHSWISGGCAFCPERYDPDHCPLSWVVWYHQRTSRISLK